ncbi:Der1-like family-domain-containing protein [Massariosphaeria phaeospora]|uniref:Derlin n=1 Tax=Massariosphaeria phaeospora TaxID=100035 RepID=A0A7C8I1L4_9PLEO|nr:Der1-like family-domain-containing protein [Massariosphaeria phaeospora]
MDVFWTLPPVTRTITALAVIVSALGYSSMISFGHVVFVSDFVFTVKMMPQLWRLVTAFFITNPKFAILMDPYMLYQYGSGLERESTRFSRPGDFFVYTVFVGSVIAGIGGYILGGFSFLQALSLAYAYTYAQDNPTRQASFFIISFPSKYLPFAMLFMTFIIDGPNPAMVQLTGLVAAHLYDFLTRIWPTFGGGKNYIYTPAAVQRLFAAKAGGVEARPYGSAQQGRPREADAATGRSTGFGERGPGRRLGD